MKRKRGEKELFGDDGRCLPHGCEDCDECTLEGDQEAEMFVYLRANKLNPHERNKAVHFTDWRMRKRRRHTDFAYDADAAKPPPRKPRR